MAEYLSLGHVDANTAMKLRDALRREQTAVNSDLSSPAYFPYQWGHAVCAYIAGRYGDEVDYAAAAIRGRPAATSDRRSRM